MLEFSQQLSATKTTSVVFEQHIRQSVADLNDVAGGLLGANGTLSHEKTPIFGVPHVKIESQKFLSDRRFLG